MSLPGVIYTNEDFSIVDEQLYYREVYGNKFEINRALFDINGPFMMDSQFEAMKRGGDRRIRKRKRPTPEDNSDPCFSEACSTISTMLPRIQKEWRESRWIDERADGERDNNRKAREAAGSIGSFSIGSGSVGDVQELSDNDFIHLQMSGGWYQNGNETDISVNVGDTSTTRQCIIPAQSSFCFGDVRNVDRIFHDDPFDLISMDPPWENRSAKRTGGYQLSDSTLDGVSLRQLSPQGLCCIWITNRKGLFEEVVEMLKHWNLELVSTWYWLKVTNKCEPIYPFMTHHKVPFERILVACPKDAVKLWKSRLPSQHVFTSIPMAVHSHKPPTQLLLRCFKVDPARSCELFARSLLPSTVSIGFEPLFLQSVDVIKSTDPSK